MAYSLEKIGLFVDSAHDSLRDNWEVAKRFCLAEDDGEVSEMKPLMHPMIHISSFWGVTRGHPAAFSLLAAEKHKLRLVWLTSVSPVTSTTFVREGYMQQLQGTGLVHSVPVLGVLWAHYMGQKKVEECLVVRQGQVVFRHLGYRWSFAVH